MEVSSGITTKETLTIIKVGKRAQYLNTTSQLSLKYT